MRKFHVTLLSLTAFFVCHLSARAADLDASHSPSSVVMVSLGDSITRAFNADQAFADNPQYSWSTGDQTSSQFDSHFLKMKRTYPGAKVTAFNYAVTGATATDLTSQVKKAIAAKADYVTILIGANDVCHWDTNYEEQRNAFVSTMHDQLSSLVTALPNSKIVVSAMPDIYHVWEVSKGNNSCQFTWDLLGICAPLLSSRSTNDERVAFRGRWQSGNDALAEVADQFAGQVRFVGEVAQYAFAAEDLSTHDCFHPSIHGQKLLGDLTWVAPFEN